VLSNFPSRAFSNRLWRKLWPLRFRLGLLGSHAGYPWQENRVPTSRPPPAEGGTYLVLKQLRQSAGERGYAPQGVNAKRGVWGRGSPI
jgi:hypothetical protein